jgi:ribonucleoside-diphosphate reductase alpha chain
MDTFTTLTSATAARPQEESTQSTMRVRKRNGSFEPVDINKIVKAVARCCYNLPSVDTLRIATKTISGLYDGATTKELDKLSIQTAASLIFEEPEYSRLAARLLNQYIEKEVRNQEIHSFSQSIAFGIKEGLINERVAQFVTANSRKLNDAIEHVRNDLFEFFGLRTLYDRYLLKSRTARDVIETPQFFWMRVACGLAETPAEAIELYRLFPRWSTCLVLRPFSTQELNTSSFQVAFCWIPLQTASKAFTASIPMSLCFPSFPAASGSLIIAFVPRVL